MTVVSAGPEQPAAHPREAHAAVMRVQAHIEQHLGEPLSLSELAEREFFHPAYFSRVFKQETGRTLTEYILCRRIERARQELRTTSKQVQRIGRELGYHSPQYFNRVFKKRVGMTPLAYRKQMQPGGGSCSASASESVSL